MAISRVLNYSISTSKVLEEERASALNGGPTVASGAPVKAAVVILLEHNVCRNVLLAPASALGPALPLRDVLSRGRVLINLRLIINHDGELCKVVVRVLHFPARHGVRRRSSSRVERDTQVVCLPARHRVSR
eukprot:6468405-Amphidinium_carterae.2